MVTKQELGDVEEDIKEIKKWSRIQGLETLKRVIEGFDDQDLIIYNEADGESTTSEIGEAAQVGNSTVSRRMNEWNRLGIVEKEGRKWKHLAPLSAMGIDVPELEDDE